MRPASMGADGSWITELPYTVVGTQRVTDRQTHRRPWPIHISPQLCLKRNVINTPNS